MKSQHVHKLIPVAMVLALTAAAAGAQRGRSPAHTIDRVADAVARVQDRAAAAQDRAARASDAASRVQDRVGGAQDRLGQVSDTVGRAGDRTVGRAGDRGAARAAEAIGARLRGAREMATARMKALQDLVRAFPDRLEMTDVGPAVRGEILVIDPDEAALAAARAAGFELLNEETIEGLGIRSITLQTPRGISVGRALARLRKIAPSAEFGANHIHTQSASSAYPVAAAGAVLAGGSVGQASAIGIIDGGVAAHASLRGPVEQRGFVAGAPTPNAHATAVASLVSGAGPVKGAEPGTPLLVADIYGKDPAGGSALALARALGWLTARKVPVVVISLVGPSNPLVGRAIARAQASGVLVVAPVGNGGPAAPPAFPASYPKVVAVTGVDGRNRALFEAGRSLHLDYSAPGADIGAANLAGGISRVRGTSFAAPLVAARLYRGIKLGRPPLAFVDREAVDLGARGPDKVYGRGLVCGACRTPVKKF